MAKTLKTPFRYQMNVRGVAYGADTLSLLSTIYCLCRDASGEGCGTFRPVDVIENGKPIGHISYNGRIWDQPLSNKFCAFTGMFDTSKLIYDSRRAS
ncbi:MAG TPA: hypothetical protein VEU47_11060 [Candidatus Cybelea sp.]|nr:hypothetical protein [Candidatus Cybelea sp.]